MKGFDLGSAVDLEDCNDGVGGGGKTSGTCSAVWNALNLDGALESTAPAATTYGKYATATILAAELAGFGIMSGANSVTLTTFANNVDWDGQPFSSANVPLNIIVTPDPDPNPIVEPGTLALFGLGLAGLGIARRRKQAA
jgi:hypothetical protein